MVDIDIEWPLDGNVKIRVTRKAGNIFVVEDVNSDRKLTLSEKQAIGSEHVRLLFNGQDIETENFMSYVGLIDEVVERLGDKGVGTVTLDEEF